MSQTSSLSRMTSPILSSRELMLTLYIPILARHSTNDNDLVVGQGLEVLWRRWLPPCMAFILLVTEISICEDWHSNVGCVWDLLPKLPRSISGLMGPLSFILLNNSVGYALKGIWFLMYVDDMKIFHSIRNLDYCEFLQSHMERFIEWFGEFSLNVRKCKKMSFTNSRSPVLYQNALKESLLQRFISFVDLGVLLNYEFHSVIT